MANAVHFFLGANSGNGFVSLFQEACRPEDHRMVTILKGGPGCGKSTFMVRLGAAMEAMDQDVEYIHCSGDPASLDGVFFPGLHAIYVDGTAPHTVEAKYPGCMDRLLDLGAYYNVDALMEKRQEVQEGSLACQKAYGEACRALRAAGELRNSIRETAEAGLDREALERRMEGVIRREIRGRGSDSGSCRRFLGTVSCRGKVCRFDTAAALCPRLFQLTDRYGISHLALEKLAQGAEHHGWDAIWCMDPEHPEELLHLLVPGLGLGFLTVRPGEETGQNIVRRIHLDGLLREEARRAAAEKEKALGPMADALEEEGVHALERTKTCHDRLESLYRPFMDFSGVDRALDRELTRWQHWQ